MRSDSSLDERMEKVAELVDDLGRSPTRQEIADAWGVALTAANSYISMIRRDHGLAIDTTDSRALMKDGSSISHKIEEVIDKVWRKHGILPSQTELASYFGCSRQRVSQIVDKYDLQVRDGNKTIVWDV